jgi:hypothetical protein
MNEHVDPNQIIHDAIDKHEVDDLLLGRPAYQYLPKQSPSPWGTDLVELLTIIVDNNYSEHVRSELLSAVDRIVTTYDGLIPVALCLLFDSVRSVNNSKNLGLERDQVAARLRKGVDIHKERLRRDKTGGGSDWEDGLLGELRNLSRNTVSVGGPPFVT